MGGSYFFFLVAGGGLTQTMITKTQQTTPYQPPAIYLGLVTSKPVVVTPTSSVFSAVCTLLLKTNTRGLFCMFATFGEDTILPWHQQPDINQTYSIRPIMGSRQANKSNLLHQTLQNALTSCQSDDEKCSFWCYHQTQHQLETRCSTFLIHFRNPGRVSITKLLQNMDCIV